MFTFIIKRLLLLIPVFLAVSLIIFMIIHLVPGDPLEHIMQVGSSPEQQAALTTKYGLDKPLLIQYLIWLQNTLSGNLGDAIILRRPVAGLIAQNLPYSLALGGLALAFSTLVGIGTGALAAIFKNGLARSLCHADHPARIHGSQLLARIADDFALRGATRLVSRLRSEER